jgi:hypothetical protein
MEKEQSLSILHAATLVDSTPEALVHEALAGRLEVSVKLLDLIAWKAQCGSLSSSPLLQAVAPIKVKVSPRVGPLTLSFGQWRQIPAFIHTWPDGTFLETYNDAFAVDVTVNNKPRVMVIGFTERAAAGMPDRARAVVFYQLPPAQRPLVEFAGDGSLLTASTYASIIKLPGGNTQLKQGNSPPDEYKDIPIDIYSHIVRGPYASSSMAVVVGPNRKENPENQNNKKNNYPLVSLGKSAPGITDEIAEISHELSESLTVMAHHGIIRGIYKGVL